VCATSSDARPGGPQDGSPGRKPRVYETQAIALKGRNNNGFDKKPFAPPGALHVPCTNRGLAPPATLPRPLRASSCGRLSSSEMTSEPVVKPDVCATHLQMQGPEDIKYVCATSSDARPGGPQDGSPGRKPGVYETQAIALKGRNNNSFDKKPFAPPGALHVPCTNRGFAPPAAICPPSGPLLVVPKFLDSLYSRNTQE
jgi:hypothetical protein